MKQRSLLVFVGTLLCAPMCFSAQLDPAALNEIGTFSATLCDIGPANGSTVDGSLSVDAKAQFNGLLRKLADLGVDANAKLGGSHWQGPLQNDLASLLNDRLTCKQHVFDRLTDTLLSERSPVRPDHHAHCPSGNRGTWSLSRQIVASSETPAGQFVDHWPVPQASCHPHCGNNQGDWVTKDFELSGQDKAANLELRNCHVTCSGNGGQFDVWSPPMNQQPTMISPSKAEVHIQSRSESCSLDISCDKVGVTKTATESPYLHGTMTNHKTFSFDVSNDTDSTLTLTTLAGTREITSEELKTWAGVPSWLAKQSQQLNGVMTTYTVSVSQNGCL